MEFLLSTPWIIELFSFVLVVLLCIAIGSFNAQHKRLIEGRVRQLATSFPPYPADFPGHV